MVLESIRLKNFRSYTDETFELAQGVNIIVGPNTSGKTSLLEAIELVTKGRSHRGATHELIKFNKQWAKIESTNNSKKRQLKIELLQNNKIKNSYVVNGQSSSRLMLDNTIPAVTFEPNNLQLLIGQPVLRREFLDELITQLKPDYLKICLNYKRTLAQRNSLLKKPASTISKQIFPWNVRLSELGGRIIKERTDLIERFNKELPKLYKQISKANTKIELKYKTKYSYQSAETQFLKDLENNVSLDRLRGFTANGPHRDDLTININNYLISETASRGEIRTIILALKILEVKIIEKARSQKPLLLLDDVFSELDGRRRQALTKFLKNYQTFITTTDADVVLQHFIDNCHIIPLNK